MLIDLAKSWAHRTLLIPDARKRVSRFFEKAQADGVPTTVGIGSKLTVNGRGCLARWTGGELIVIELMESQRERLNLLPNGMFAHAGDPRGGPVELPSERLVTLSDVRLDGDDHDSHRPLSGTCRLAGLDNTSVLSAHCALRAQVFRPQSDRQLTMYWHANTPSLLRAGHVRFEFAPIARGSQPSPIQGLCAIYLQFVTMSNGTTLADLKAVSNAVGILVDIR